MAFSADNCRVFQLRLPATAPSIAIFRAGLRRWLEELHVSPAEVFDIVLACSESLTLVIEEQPRQVALVVDVEAELDGDHLRLTTRDYGLCHETHVHEGEEPLGLSLMRALMDTVDHERHADGQRITLSKRVQIVDGEPRALPV